MDKTFTMKVLFVEYCDYDHFPVGGQHTFIRTLLDNIDVDARLVGIVTDARRAGGWSRKNVGAREFPFFALRQINLKAPKRPLLPRRIIFYYDLIRYRKMLLKIQPDIIYIHSPEAVLPFLKIAQAARIPLVLHLHGAMNPLTYSRFKWARNTFLKGIYEACVYRKAVRHVERVITISQDGETICKQFRRDLPPNWCCITLGVNQDQFKPMNKAACRDRFKFNETDKIVIFVGRLAKVKGLELLLEATGRLAKEEPRLILVLVGEGEERAALQEKAERMGLGKTVVFTGMVSHAVLPHLLSSADVFAMTSHFEGMPNVVLEALACGLPVVATAVGGIVEIIQDNVNGFLVEKRDPNLLVSKLRQALCCPNSMRKHAVETIQNSYSIASQCRRIEALFREVVQEKAL